jgi:hypothetical protein
MIGMDVELGGRRRLLHSEEAAFRLAVGRIPVPHVLVDWAGLGDATPLGLLVIGGGTQGRPSCLRPTLGWGTQSRWDW